MKRFFALNHQTARDRAIECIREAPQGWEVIVREPARNLEQNALAFVIYQAFSEQVKWLVNGEMVYMEPLDWKDVLSCAYRRETRVANGLGNDGSKVMLGARTSEFTKPEFSEYLEFLHMVAADRGVKL